MSEIIMDFESKKQLLLSVDMNFELEARRLEETIAAFFYDAPEDTTLETTLRELRIVDDPACMLSTIKAELTRLKLVLAGGAITSLMSGAKVNDLDFYLEDIKLKDEAITFLSKYFKEPPFVSPNCVTLKRKKGRKIYTAQLVTRFSGMPADIFDKFDFTITTGAYRFSASYLPGDLSPHAFYFGEHFFQDLASKRLVYLGASQYPICALWRTKKYQARGYYCPGSTIMHISLSIVRLEIKTYKELKEQLLGIDTIYLQKLLAKECYAEHLPVDYGKFVENALNELNVYQPEEE